MAKLGPLTLLPPATSVGRVTMLLVTMYTAAFLMTVLIPTASVVLNLSEKGVSNCQVNQQFPLFE